MTNLTKLASDIFEANKAKGFWDRERDLTETTMLIVTELAEAVEEDRAGREDLWFREPVYDMRFDADVVKMDDDGLAHPAFDPGSRPLKPEGVDIELIDALIRLLDLLGSRDVDVDELMRIKMSFNASRPARHGKAY